MSPRDLLDAEGAIAIIDRYLKDMSTLTPEQRLKFLEKARAKKAQPDSKVDVLSQLEIAEGDKKKRKVEAARLSVAIRAKAPNLLRRRMLLLWRAMFSPELFLEKLVNMAGNSFRLYTTPTDDLLRMALGHELKGLLLNYALAARQRSEVASAQEKVAAADKGLASLEKDFDVAKNKLKGEVKALKKSSEEDISKLAKAHEEELAKVKKDREAAMKTMQVLQESLDAKEARLATLAKDNEAALAELATLKREKESWASEKESLEEAIGAQYDDDFNFALDQVKVLFPDIDQTLMGKADAMLRIDGNKLVPYAPVETLNVEESPVEE